MLHVMPKLIVRSGSFGGSGAGAELHQLVESLVRVSLLILLCPWKMRRDLTKAQD